MEAFGRHGCLAVAPPPHLRDAYMQCSGDVGDGDAVCQRQFCQQFAVRTIQSSSVAACFPARRSVHSRKSAPASVPSRDGAPDPACSPDSPRSFGAFLRQHVRTSRPVGALDYSLFENATGRENELLRLGTRNHHAADQRARQAARRHEPRGRSAHLADGGRSRARLEPTARHRPRHNGATTRGSPTTRY